MHRERGTGAAEWPDKHDAVSAWVGSAPAVLIAMAWSRQADVPVVCEHDTIVIRLPKKGTRLGIC